MLQIVQLIVVRNVLIVEIIAHLHANRNVLPHVAQFVRYAEEDVKLHVEILVRDVKAFVK